MKIFHLVFSRLATWKLVAVAAFALTTGSAEAVSVSVSADADSRLKESHATSNYGTNDYTEINANWPGHRDRGMVWFDLVNDLPGFLGSTVNSATLYMYFHYDDASSGTTRTHDVNRLTESWTESGVSWNRRDGTTDWGTAGGSFNPIATASRTVSTGDVHTWLTWAVTADVIAFASGADNYGWIIKDVEATSTEDKWQYRTKEYNSGSKAPYLVVDYTPSGAVPEPATLLLLASGLAGLIGIAWRRHRAVGILDSWGAFGHEPCPAVSGQQGPAGESAALLEFSSKISRFLSQGLPIKPKRRSGVAGGVGKLDGLRGGLEPPACRFP